MRVAAFERGRAREDPGGVDDERDLALRQPCFERARVLSPDADYRDENKR